MKSKRLKKAINLKLKNDSIDYVKDGTSEIDTDPISFSGFQFNYEGEDVQFNFNLDETWQILTSDNMAIGYTMDRNQTFPATLFTYTGALHKFFKIIVADNDANAYNVKVHRKTDNVQDIESHIDKMSTTKVEELPTDNNKRSGKNASIY